VDNKTNLPEKDFFSVLDIMEEWGRDLEYMKHVFAQNKIRPAVQVKNLDRVYGIKLSDIPEVSLEQELPSWLTIYNSDNDITEFFPEGLPYHGLTGFFYRTNMWAHTEAVEPNGNEYTCLIEDFDGNIYIPIKKETYKTEGEEKQKILLAHFLLGRLQSHGDETFCDYIITREERDRFISEYSIVKEGEGEVSEPFQYPIRKNDGAVVICDMGNDLTKKLGRIPRYHELKNHIIDKYEGEYGVEALTKDGIKIGDSRITKKDFKSRFDRYIGRNKED